MKRSLLVRNLGFFWRIHAAVALGVATGTATLCGALLVGDSMRASLTGTALQRLGSVDHALTAPRFFREALAAELERTSDFSERFSNSLPLIVIRGSATHAETKAIVQHVQVFGVDQRFWTSAALPHDPREVIVNERLAQELRIKAGEDFLLRIGNTGKVSPETLLGRRDEMTHSLRLKVGAIVPGESLGALSLNPSPETPRNVYVPLATLQRTLQKTGRCNAILVTSPEHRFAGNENADQLQGQLRDLAALEDFDIRLREAVTHGYVAVESERFLLEPVAERAALAAASSANLTPNRVLTYLANEIRLVPGPDTDQTPEGAIERRASIPYSTVSAFDRLSLQSHGPGREITPGTIHLNQWAADALGVHQGATIELAYYVTEDFGKLRTDRESFRLADIVPLEGLFADRGFTPDFPGVTDADTMADWDPPFPVDLKKIGDADEDYWKQHRATPKAFVSLADGQRLWAKDGDRHGRLTSIRMEPAPGPDLHKTAEDLERELRRNLDPAEFGMQFEPVRANALRAGTGNTDFGMLFIGFSFFMILSASLLVFLLFRLHVERRSSELGLLLALGFSPKHLMRGLLAEGAVVAGAGSLVGVAGAVGYAWLMLSGLRTWWSAAVNAPFLQLHVTGKTVAIGAACGWLLSMMAIAWAAFTLMKRSSRALLAGPTEGTPRKPTRTEHHGWRPSTIVAIASLLSALIAIALPLIGTALPQSIAFFLSGAAMLTFTLTTAYIGLHRGQARLRGPRGIITSQGLSAGLRLGIRNAGRQPVRSLLTMSLMASATFLIASLEAFRMTPGTASGSAEYSLVAESAVSLTADLNTAEGREALNFQVTDGRLLDQTVFVPFRLQAGDETSCLNLYRPTHPRVIGAGDAMIQRGGFAFSASSAESAEERKNPWTLLRRSFPDGTIPVIGDESAVKWQLHLGLNQVLEITDELGRPARLRFVALLQGSVLQSELTISEQHFKTLYPSSSGYGFFLISTPPERADDLTKLLEQGLADFGFDVTTTFDRMSGYLAVQNTYLSTFQTLGGFGLVLGSFGLVAVMLRNLWERRRELAVMRSLGFSRAAIGVMVVAENAYLIAVGVSAGLVAALLAVAPHLVHRASSMPWTLIATTLGGVLLVGIGAATIALIGVLRSPLLPALRRE